MKTVLWFAGEMYEKLEKNKHKGGWKDCDKKYLLNRLKQEVAELNLACSVSDGIIDPNDIRREAADVANFAMMIADNFGRGDD